MRHVLIIEDQPLIANTLADMARFGGAASVDIADTAADAIAAAERKSPDIIISDVDLGVGGYGPTAVSAILDRFGRVPAIFVTGHADDAQAHACAAAVLTKPVSAQRLADVMATVATALHDRRPRQSRRRSLMGERASDAAGQFDVGAGLTTGHRAKPR